MTLTQLTAREMFDLLVQGKKVAMTTTKKNCPEIRMIINHLNVIKSRSKRIFDDLGLIFENTIVKTFPADYRELEEGFTVEIFLVPPDKQRKYSAYIIIDDACKN